MLVSLRIKNLALVEDLSLELGEGFNSITGETGAGKSILIGALSLVLGERADRDWIRSGSESCAVEAVFEGDLLKSFASLLEEFGLEPCQDGQLLLKRVFGTATNRQFVNGSPTTLQILKQMGQKLVDMHGPHDHQSLLRVEAQLQILDRFAGLEKERKDFAASLQKVREIEDQKRALVMDEKEFQQQLDLLEHQVAEIEGARLQPDEESQLEADYKVATNGQKLLDLIGRVQEVLFEGESNASGLIAQAQRALRDLAAVDSGAEPFQEANEKVSEELQELNRELSRYASKIDLDPDRLNFLSERMTLIQSLKRKYGKSLAEVIEFGAAAKKRLQELQSREENLAKLEQQSKEARRSMEKTGMALRCARQKAIPKLVKEVTHQLKDLGFLQSEFSCELSPTEPSSSGMDVMEFRFSPNPGESQKPLREIASSGEMARVMLALKTALADQDEVPVLIFDEVDANVGGEIGTKVGEKMAEIGKEHQVLCITHLPQVAAFGMHHFQVVKIVEKGRTFTKIEELSSEDRVEEIARMLGGKSGSAVQHAKELLKAGIQNPESRSQKETKKVATARA